jgi:hypothetical protein
MVYFRQGVHYLATYEADLNSLRDSAISNTDVDDVLSQTRAAGTLLILDCCESAGFAENAPEFFRQIGQSGFRILLSASRVGQRSWERAGGKGTLFTHFLKKAISGDEAIAESPASSISPSCLSTCNRG